MVRMRLTQSGRSSNIVASWPTALSATLITASPAFLQRPVFQRTNEVSVLVRTHSSALSSSSSNVANCLLAFLRWWVVCWARLQADWRVRVQVRNDALQCRRDTSAVAVHCAGTLTARTGRCLSVKVLRLRVGWLLWIWLHRCSSWGWLLDHGSLLSICRGRVRGIWRWRALVCRCVDVSVHRRCLRLLCHMRRRRVSWAHIVHACSVCSTGCLLSLLLLLGLSSLLRQSLSLLLLLHTRCG